MHNHCCTFLEVHLPNSTFLPDSIGQHAKYLPVIVSELWFCPFLGAIIATKVDTDRLILKVAAISSTLYRKKPWRYIFSVAEIVNLHITAPCGLEKLAFYLPPTDITYFRCRSRISLDAINGNDQY